MENNFQNSSINLNILFSPKRSGKSEIANKFAELVSKNNNYVYWFKGDAQTFNLDYKIFAQNLEIDTTNLDELDMISQVNGKLDMFVKKILLIIDDCTDYILIEKFLKSIPKDVCILITTKNEEILKLLDIDKINLFNVDSFKKSECIDLMRTMLGAKVKAEIDLEKLFDLICINSDTMCPSLLSRLLENEVKKKIGIQPLKKFLKEYKLIEIKDVINLNQYSLDAEKELSYITVRFNSLSLDKNNILKI